uniref:Addiction module toxin RelE n=1 Tax=Desulfatirhabdium butyrativorans TaxID=340467 RepID=A0A7C4MLB6_9BACT
MTCHIELHPEAVKDFASLDASVQKEIARKIDALSENPFLGKPLGNKMGINLSGFFKLYAVRKKYRIVYRLIGDRLEVIENVGIGKREREEIYKLIGKRTNK